VDDAALDDALAEDAEASDDVELAALEDDELPHPARQNASNAPMDTTTNTFLNMTAPFSVFSSYCSAKSLSPARTACFPFGGRLRYRSMSSCSSSDRESSPSSISASSNNSASSSATTP